MDKPSEGPSRGWILYHRKSVKHHLRSKPLIWIYFLHCMEEAAFEDHNIFWSGKEFMLRKGSFITSIERDVVKNGITISHVRRARSILKTCGMITVKSTRNGSLISVVNYTKLQDWRSLLNQHLSSINSQSEQKDDKQTANRPQQHKEIERNINNYKEFKSADARMSKDEMKQDLIKKRGCSDHNFYGQIIKSKCSKAIDEGNLSLDDITNSWTSGIHYNDVIELFKD